MNYFLPLAVLSLGTIATAQQLPCWNPNLGTNLGLTDESVSVAQPLGFNFVYGGVSWSNIQVCDNGYVTLGATGGVAVYTPSPSTLVGAPIGRICPFWVDLDPGATGSGDVYFNAVPASGFVPAHAIITWLDVYEYNGSTPHTFQLVLIDGGGIRVNHRRNLENNTSPWLIGASPGGGLPQNPVSLDSLPIATAGNPTLHHDDPIGDRSPLTGITVDWLPDGTGGFVVDVVSSCAATTAYGTGCVARHTSFYEWFVTTTSIDLSNTAFQMALTGNSYTVSASTTAFIAPSPTASNLNLTDDSETTIVLGSALPFPGGVTTSLRVCSNGFVSAGSTGAALDFSPTPSEFLNWPSTTWAVWHDLIPGIAGGAVWLEQVGTLTIVTWDNIVGYVGTSPGNTPSTFQLQFDRSNGKVTYVFASLDNISVSTWPGGAGWVIGFTVAGPSLDPGSTDLSSTLAAGNIVTEPADLAPLTIDSLGLPVANGSVSFEVTNIPTTALFGGLLLGVLRFDPGINLSPFGMPGCFQYNEQIAISLLFPNGAPTVSVPFGIPSFTGIRITAQAAAYDPVAPLTPLGAIASNGIALRIGN